MSPAIAQIRRQSAALFGNEKVVEVVLALDAVPEPRSATAQQLSVATGIGHSMVRDVLQRLTQAGTLAAMAKVGGSRSAQYYQPVSDELWSHLVAICAWVNQDLAGPAGVDSPRIPHAGP